MTSSDDYPAIYVPEAVSSKAYTSDLQSLLTGILRTIVRLPWLHTEAGGVFLADGERRCLNLVAHVNFAPQIQGSCSQVAYGHCLCGRVAESGQLLHVDCVDHRHDIRYPEMQDHGHYVLPIMDGEELLGVLVLYVEVGHVREQEEVDALRDFAAVMATVIRVVHARLDKQVADLVIAHSAHGVLVADRDRRILWVNRAFEKTTGYRLAEVRGRTPKLLASGRHDAAFYRRMWRQIRETGQWQGEIWNRRKNGEIYPEWLNIIALRNDRGEVERYAGMFIDLTEIRRAEAHIHRLAYFDLLTGLPNRTRFVEKLAEMLADVEGAGQCLAVLVLDLDHFHPVNEALGREAGDALLQEAGRRLDSVTSGALVARVEPDEFLVALPERAVDEAALLCQVRQQAERILAAFESGFELSGQALNLGMTAGLACSQPGDTPDRLLTRAGRALREAKQTAKGTLRIFDTELARQAEYERHIVLHIEQAVSRNELFLHFQPQLDQGGRIVGAETLVRWSCPDLGIIPPDVFIQHAEESGAIVAIGRWVFEQAVRHFEQWRRLGLVGHDDFVLAINLSPAQLVGDGIAERFRTLCERYAVPCSVIELEVTESAMVHGRDGQMQKQLVDLATCGFRLAIDDFGTGHSSLSRLHALPIDSFKLDRSFVQDIETGGRPLAIVKSLIAMAHELGHAVIAEGIENDRQLAILRNLGCEYYQGYWFSPPLDEAAFTAYLREHPPT